MPHRTNLPETASVAHALTGARLQSPSADRNAGPITEVLRRHAPLSGTALEIASGTGQHVVHFARALPGLIWQPTEIDAQRRASINAWAESAALPNLRPARALDATAPGWAAHHPDQNLIILINLVHLISTPETRTLISQAASALAPAGRFVLYGPFLRGGRPTSRGDAQFDASLRAHDPAIGYKDLAEVQQWLADAKLQTVAAVDMPANNLTLITERSPNSPKEIPECA